MRRFGLIGEHLSHSFSPMIHEMIGGYAYGLYPVARENLALFMNETDLDGFNVTIPYKKDVIPFCSVLGREALAVGAVNTVTRLQDGGWRGDNTDCDGFKYLLKDDAACFKGQKALVLGSGGASRAVQTALEDLGVAYVVISRSGADNYENAASNHADAALIVNATPVGMYPHAGASPIALDAFTNLKLVADLIYNPARTELMLRAQALRIRAVNGLIMLAAQAVRAAELFMGRSFPPALCDEIAAAVAARTLNVALIGMPGCGKTTVGRILSELTGRPFSDTDEMVLEKTAERPPKSFCVTGRRSFAAWKPSC
jgi:shikimate dehydrogenase